MTSSHSSSPVVVEPRPSRRVGLRVFFTLITLALSVVGVGVPSAAAAAPVPIVAVGATPSVQVNLCLLQPNGDWPWRCPR